MKQGRASQSGMSGAKVEPKARAVSIDHVAEMGAHQVRMQNQPPKPGLYKGRGYEAPKSSDTVHHCGSQGKH